ncbi:hypothetical protein BDV28DRAFT_130402 [Aspergillus coremiiformis]|uniref:DUF6604 domain-containing protein n=1 Tax=Aspergillus coremiiformis TaxID=138285 RepID=A0A5N6ZAQ3_9EURO|nr:hypothetical protein BDV28DRAFT_130402 [Aspergillus coremiiformis]
MLSEFLTSSYLQYKEDTNSVASWLATTAKKCGYPVNSSSAAGTPTGRLKGKARKAAKAQKASTTPSSRQPTYTIAIKDFVNLAELIASYNNPPIRVPSSFVTILERAISTRRRHGDFLPTKDHIAAQGHNYFIGILEHVRDTLRFRFPVEMAATEDNPRQKDDVNKFVGLEVQEPSKEFLQAPDVPATASLPPVDSEAKYEAERMQNLEEAWFALKLLVEDYNTFRTVIRETWSGYRQGVFDLVAVSLMTNTALDLARRLENDAEIFFAQVGGPEEMLKMMYLALCMEKGEDHTFQERLGDDMNFRMWEASSAIFLPAYLLLEAFVRIIDSRHIPVYKPGFYGQYDPASDRTKKNAREKFQEDKIILTEDLGEFALLCMTLPHFAAEDELTRGLRTAFRTHKIPLALVFATQVYLDIHHVLREDISRGYADLQTTAEMIDNSINLNFEHHASLRVETWPRSNDLVFKQLQQDIDNWVKHDPLTMARKRLKRPPGDPFKLMRSHPLFCGLIAYHFKVIFQEVSVVFVNAWGAVMYIYHLYNAARQEKLLTSRWHDMEIIMGLQGDVFVGDAPRTPDDYLKRFALSMGYSATAFARDRRQVRESARGPRGLQELAPVTRMFKARFCEDSGQTDWTREDIEYVLSKSEWHVDELPESLGELSLTRNARKQHAPSSSGQGSTRRPLNTIELLQRLRNAVQGEALELAFPYLSLHRMCWLLLRRINEECHQNLRDLFGFRYLEKENQLPFVVGYIFMAASGTKKLGNLLSPQNSDQVTSKLLLQAASVLESYIANCGRVACGLLGEQNIMVVEETDDEDGDAESG